MSTPSRERGNPISATGEHVAANVKRLRQLRGWTQAELSERMSFHPIPPASIGKLETQRRKVEVDDLVALAVALEVSPVALLMPHTAHPDEPVSFTGGRAQSREAWSWAIGDSPYYFDSSDYEDVESDWSAFRSRSLPWWLRLEVRFPSDDMKPAVRANRIASEQRALEEQQDG